MATDFDMEVRKRLRAYMNRKNIKPTDERSDLKVDIVRPDVAPVRGSVHISTGRVESRKAVEKRFRTGKFI